MFNRKTLVQISIMLVLFTSCSLLPTAEVASDKKIPLSQKWSISLDSDIYSMVMSDDWFVVSTSNGLTAIAAETGEILWSKDLLIDPESELLMSNGMVIAGTSDGVKLFEKSGEEIGKIISKNGSIELVTAFSDYIYAIRKPTWNLEVYNIKTLNLSWSESVDRGGLNIFYDEFSNIVYVATLSYLRAVDPPSGKILWESPLEAEASYYDSGVLYYFGASNGKQPAFIAAFDVNKKKEIWKSNITGESFSSVGNMMVLDNLLVITTQSGVVAFDKNSGGFLWQSECREQFFASPVLLSDIIYAKASLVNTIFALSADDGHTIGSNKLTEPTIFAQPYYEYTSGVFLLDHSIIFSSAGNVYIYAK